MDESCENRIGKMLDARIDELDRIFNLLDFDYTDYPDPDDEDFDRDDLPDLPEDYEDIDPGDIDPVEIEIDEEGNLADSYATYRFLDWSDGATRRTDDDSVLRMLDYYAQGVSV